MSTISRLFLCLLATLPAACTATRRVSFDTPEAALRYLLLAAEDRDAAETLLGPGGFELLRSGDEVADRQDFEAVVALLEERLVFEDLEDGRKLALLGHEAWEFPIPLARVQEGWEFDVEAGRQEVLNRRVGRNEISTIETLRAIVEAQREYRAAGHGGQGPAYAQRLLSSPGQRDGLYWPAAEGEAESPLGPFVAEAAAEGYRDAKDQRIPYHGYLYRLLTSQGRSAPGAERSYIDAAGRLTGGFAVLAWPATYGNSGVKTFIVNQQGLVFEKDLGPDTAQLAPRIRAYDPDTSWDPTRD
ncbi:MAG: DUF2950 domain-containing protein [Planctomycetes bacterium]|nr:DUF2950 domain-containing protein [Planctomycetota bacterium]